MKTSFRNLILLILMVSSALIAWASRPHIFLADERPKLNLEELIPIQFGDWREIKQSGGQIINPQVEEKLNALYSQILMRTYANTQGERVMLSIAYGKDQRSYMAAHYPEVCYPAQGFSLRSKKVENILLADLRIPVRRLETDLGGQRYEPVTYWTTIGDHGSLGGLSKRLIELQYGVEGKIPDGLVFRVSSIGKNSEIQFQIQENFIKSLLSTIGQEKSILLTGNLVNSH